MEEIFSSMGGLRDESNLVRILKRMVPYYLTPVRMAIIKMSTNNKCWRGCGEKGSLLHYWWESKLV